MYKTKADKPTNYVNIHEVWYDDLHKATINLTKTNVLKFECYCPWTDEYIWNFRLHKYMKLHNMTVQDWYDIVILKIDSIKDRPTCKICGSSVRFGTISTGYSSTCSRSCQGILTASCEETQLQHTATYKKNIALLTEDEYRKRHCGGKCWSESTRKAYGAKMKQWHANDTNKQRFKAIIATTYTDIWRLNQHNAQVEAWLNKDIAKVTSQYKYKHGIYDNAKCCTNIASYRSSYEFDTYKLLDDLQWQYTVEPFRIKYKVDGITHAYTPDLLVAHPIYGSILCEIKPMHRLKRDFWNLVKAYVAYKYVQQSNNIQSMVFILDNMIYASKDIFEALFVEQLNYLNDIEHDKNSIPWSAGIITNRIKERVQICL